MGDLKQKTLDAQYRQIAIVSFAMIVSVAMYMLVAWFLPLKAGDLGELGIPWIAMAAIGLGLLAAAPMIPRMLMGKLPPTATVEERIVKFKAATMVGFALRESAAVIGLMITMLTGDFRWVAALGSLTILVMLFAFPKRSQLEKLGQEIPPIG